MFCSNIIECGCVNCGGGGGGNVPTQCSENNITDF